MLIATILADKPYPFHHGDLYPHVTYIGGKKISPDIDILQKIPSHNLVVGYEVKWLYFSEKRGTSWFRFYRGIGQALCYFLHGVTHAYLVLGWDTLPEEDVSRILDYFKIFENLVIASSKKPEEIDVWLRGKMFRSYIDRCFGLITFGGDRRYEIRGNPVQFRTESFPIKSIEDAILRNKIETNRTNLLAIEPRFKWEKRFEKKWRTRAQ